MKGVFSMSEKLYLELKALVKEMTDEELDKLIDYLLFLEEQHNQ